MFPGEANKCVFSRFFKMHIFQLSNWLYSSFWEQYRKQQVQHWGEKKKERKKKKYKVNIPEAKGEQSCTLGGYWGAPSLVWESSKLHVWQLFQANVLLLYGLTVLLHTYFGTQAL